MTLFSPPYLTILPPAFRTLDRKKLETMNKKVEAEIAAAAQTNAQLEALKSTLNELESQSPPSHMLKKTQDLVSKDLLDAAHVQLKESYQNQLVATKELEALKAAADASRKQVVLLKSDLIHSRAKVDAFVKDIQNWKEKCDKLTKELETLRKQRDSGAHEENTENCHQLASQLSAIKDNLLRATSERDQARASADKLSHELASLSNKVTELENDLATERHRSPAVLLLRKQPAFSIFSIHSWVYIGLSAGTAYVMYYIFTQSLEAERHVVN
ncbi:hypothetical protein SeMB42_g07638 [Synchytrium endobioticum]|uniref:Uncharacterized protein n=1 Tax=Synchytrium endobioticum TaxID=286115 RepID=A0A507BYW1_9FUNG|nr:hypothetical protein SeMB42_g07638 [Synchytrium endobioticum]